MFRLNFTTRVMGEDGAERVRRQEVFETLRSERSDIARAFSNGTLTAGDEIEVALDGEIIGKASLSVIDRTDWDGITLIDARESGFTSMPGLSAALRRAGYHVSPIDHYLFYRVQFAWREEGGQEYA